MTGPLVRVDDLHVHFGDARAVDGVSIEIHTGEVLALVGESGSGKTTLIRAIQGLQVPTAGQVSIEGKPAERGGHGEIQMIFQDPTGALNPRQTIYEVVSEGLRVRKDKGDEATRVAEALSKAGLRPPERFMPLYPHEISGGQRQRVVIAGAMILGPRLLLADEPVASLDASIRGEILALMRNLVDAHGLAILVVTHDLGLAWNIADRVAVMYLGRIVETGTTEELLANPKHPYTRALLSVVPETVGMEQQILTGEIPDPKNVPSGCRFHPRCPLLQSGESERLGIADRCRGEDLPILPADHAWSAACWATEPSLQPQA
jgi:oligopeptide/dipeptide ABC transporter ATP-binding protein